MILGDRNDERLGFYGGIFTGGWAVFVPLFVVFLIIYFVLHFVCGDTNSGAEWAEIVFGTILIALVACLVIGGIMALFTYILSLLSDTWMGSSHEDDEPLWLNITGLVLFLVAIIFLAFVLDTHLEGNIGKDRKPLVDWLKGWNQTRFNDLWKYGGIVGVAVLGVSIYVPWLTAHIMTFVAMCKSHSGHVENTNYQQSTDNGGQWWNQSNNNNQSNDQSWWQQSQQQNNQQQQQQHQSNNGNDQLIEAYLLLGLDETATVEEIKKAHKEKARKYHPDINKSPSANAMMQKINAAYDLIKENRGIE